MTSPRSVVAAAALVIVVATLAVGPLLGVATTDDAGERPVGDGTATVAVVDVPDDPRFVSGQYGADALYLQLDDATVHVSDVEGRPVVYYELRIPAIGYSLATGSVLSDGTTGQVALTYEGDTFTPNRLTERSYDGTVRVWTRTTDGVDVLHERAVTVEVRR